jgi:hypothetical protein
MKTPGKTKQKILAIVLVALAVSVLYRVTHPFKQETVDELTFDKKKHFKRIYGETDTDHRGSPTGIMLNFIDTPTNHSGRVFKNIFSPQPSVPGQDDKTKSDDKKQDLMAVDAENLKDNEFSRPENIGTGLSDLKVFGMYENEQDKVVFVERGKDILALREGDTIDGTFRVQKISNKLVTIKSKHSDRSLSINMNELENN